MRIDAEALAPENERLVREIGIPPCPQVLMEVMREVRSDDTNLNRISHLISKDVGLSAAILKTANSPFYGIRHKVTSIQGALSAVGLRNAASLIAGLMLRRAFASINHAAMHEFWEVTSKVGLTAAYLGRELGVASINDAHTYALFRDCGEPLLMQKFPDYCATVKSAVARDSENPMEMECSRYGTHHASVGATLAMSWYLPGDIWQAIQVHHVHQEPLENAGNPRDKTATLVALGTLADGMFRASRGVATSANMERDEELARATLGVRPEEIEPLQPDIDRILRGD